MPIVLVHGNPETTAIWDDLLLHLGRTDVVTLSPPGFGAPVPAGFGATIDDYISWLIETLATIPGPIDLVGHDLGAGCTVGAVSTHPQLVRSWAIDSAGVYDPAYVQHEQAQRWQAPATGEAAIAQTVALPKEQLARGLAGLGMSTHAAARSAAVFDEVMGRCILTVYRSVTTAKLADMSIALPQLSARPGLVIVATEDHLTGGEILARRTAERAGAQVAVLEGLGHWWMCQNPQQGAEVLRAFLATLT